MRTTTAVTALISGSKQPQVAFDDPAAESSIGSRISDGPVITLIACNVALLVMLVA